MCRGRMFHLMLLWMGFVIGRFRAEQINLCTDSTGVVAHFETEKYARQWEFVARGCESPGSTLLLNLTSTNLTCETGDMSLGISAFDETPNLCSFRRGGCFEIRSSNTSMIDSCTTKRSKQREHVLPVTIALSKTASTDSRGFQIQYRYIVGNTTDGTRTLKKEPGITNSPRAARATNTYDHVSTGLYPGEGTGPAITGSNFDVDDSTNGWQTEATSFMREGDFDSSDGANADNIYFLLTIAFGTLLIFSLLLVAVLCVRLARKTRANSDGSGNVKI